MKTQTVEPKSAWERFWHNRWKACDPLACWLNRMLGVNITGKQLFIAAMVIVFIAAAILGWRNA